MAFADVNGQHIYYEDSGGDGAAVLFSHGFLMDHGMFRASGLGAGPGVPLHHVGRARIRRDAGH